MKQPTSWLYGEKGSTKSCIPALVGGAWNEYTLQALSYRLQQLYLYTGNQTSWHLCETFPTPHSQIT